MEFIKTFDSSRTFKSSFGSAIIKDGFVRIRLPNNVKIVEKGFIEGGIGIVTEPKKPGKTPYTLLQQEVDKSYLPTELTGKSYKFFIPAEKLSENEFVFMYKKAKMLNK